MKITNIEQLRKYIVKNSHFKETTVNNVILALGFPLRGSGQLFEDLTAQLKKCALFGADFGISGFINKGDNINFFLANRADIVNNMETTAADCGMDIISMVQEFGIFRNSKKPTPREVGKALWDGSKLHSELRDLYNVFAWYALEEISRTWYRYIEENLHYVAA
jgi:hypothetical protein